jgi:DNA topoisomerase-1
MISFGKVLPRIRRRVKRDLNRHGLPRERVLATVVRLLETTLIRVGNDEYARENGSYGLTTMRNRHVRVARDKLEFTFRGKSGKRHEISIRDPHLAKIVRRCQDLPGQELFEYEDESGIHRIGSDDVNAYLREIAGEDFTAKDFRTWAGTVLAALALREFGRVDSHGQAKKNIVSAIEAVSKMLGNTPAVCRSCYIHPEILQSYLDGRTISVLSQRASRKIERSIEKLKPEEAAVLVLLQRSLKSNGARCLHGCR